MDLSPCQWCGTLITRRAPCPICHAGVIRQSYAGLQANPPVPSLNSAQGDTIDYQLLSRLLTEVAQQKQPTPLPQPVQAPPPVLAGNEARLYTNPSYILANALSQMGKPNATVQVPTQPAPSLEMERLRLEIEQLEDSNIRLRAELNSLPDKGAKASATSQAEAEADQAKREKEELLKAHTRFQNTDQVPKPDPGAQLISDNAVSSRPARYDDKSDAIQDKHTSPMIPYRNQSLSYRDESQIPSFCGRHPVPLSHSTVENESRRRQSQAETWTDMRTTPALDALRRRPQELLLLMDERAKPSDPSRLDARQSSEFHHHRRKKQHKKFYM